MINYQYFSILSFFIIINFKLFSEEIKKKSNLEKCNQIRIERRSQIYEAVNITEIKKLLNDFLIKAQELNKIDLLLKAASVSNYDPFFHSDQTEKEDLKSKKDFVKISNKVLNELGNNINGINYKKANGKLKDETPYILFTSENDIYRESLVAIKPKVSVGRFFKNTKLLNLEYLNQFSTLTLIIEQYFKESDNNTILEEPLLEINTTKKSNDQITDESYTFSQFIEKTLPNNCENEKIEYDSSFNSISKEVKLLNQPNELIILNSKSK